jgi:hypothetical protein
VKGEASHGQTQGTREKRYATYNTLPRPESKTTMVAAEDAVDACAACGKKEGEGDIKLKRCMACKNTKYCGAECQKLNWRQHKKSCEYLQIPTVDRAYAGEEGSEPSLIPGMTRGECIGCDSGCSCASKPSDPKSMWRLQGGEKTFLGIISVTTPKGLMFKKLDDPKDFLDGGDPTLPGHYQTSWEFM